MPEHHRLHNARLTAFLSGIFLGCVLGTRPLIPLLSSQNGASSFQVGVIVAVFALLPALVIVPVGRMAGRLAAWAKLFLTVFAASAGFALIFLFSGLPGIYVSQLVSGLAYALFLVAALEFIEHCSTPETRDSKVMRLSIGNAVGSFIGPAVGGGLSDLFGYEPTFLILGGVGIAASFLTFFLVRDEGKPQARRQAAGSAFGLLALPGFRRAIAISVLVLLGKDMYTAYFPLLGEQFGYSPTLIGVAVSLNALAGIFVRVFLTRMIGAFGKAAVLAGSFVLSAACFAVIPLFPQAAMQLALSFLLGLGLGIGQPLSMSESLAALPKDRLGDGLGLRISFNRTSQVASPVLFGGLSAWFGLSGIFWGVCLAILAGLYMIRNRANPGAGGQAQ